MADERSFALLRAKSSAYLVALIGTGAVFGVRVLLDPYTSSQASFLLFAVPAVIGGWVGGLGPGLLATVASGVLLAYFFLVPYGSFAVGTSAEVIGIGVFLLQGAAISLLGESRIRGLARLLTERATLEERVAQRTAELSESNAQLKRSNEELESFASVASHDLQEPLRKIRAFGSRLEAAAGQTLDPASRDYLDRMLSSTVRMQTLIEGLLTLSRVSTRRRELVRMNLAGVVAEVLVDLENRIETTGATIRLHHLPEAVADPLQMRQLFLNLIGNALKFGRLGAPLTVDVRGREDEDHILVEVEDNGIGFEAQHADRIFGLFQRLHGRGVYEGTGLGLALCRRIVENHGGTIEAIGRPGEGALLRFTLPKDRFA